MQQHAARLIANTVTSSTANFTAPHWLRLTRSGNTFTCHRSTDGITWFQLGPPETIADAPATMHAGMMIASINNNGNSVVTIDNLALLESQATDTGPVMQFAAGQNPQLSNNFTLASSADRPVTWSWQKLSGPGNVTFRTQNTGTPQTAFSQAGSYAIRALAEAGGIATFIDRTFDFQLNARWDFNTAGNAEGWTTANPANATVANGVIGATVSATDPQVYKTGAVYVSGDLAKHMLVRYRSSATGGSQLFWGSMNAGGFVGTRSVTTTYPTANVWRDINLNPSSSVNWLGQIITDLRFDPTGSTNATYQIDWIALSDGVDVQYNSWRFTNAPTGTPSDDFDGDGVPNAIEYVLGGTATGNDLGKLPVISTSGGNMIFRFIRDQNSIDTSTNVAIEVGNTLSAWPETYLIPTTATANNPGVTVIKNSPGPGSDTVTLTVPQGSPPRKFARLKVIP